MFCPACLQQPLRANRLNSGLPVNACEDCHGLLVPLTVYRDWVDRMSVQEGSVNGEVVTPVQDSTRALHCPKCTRLMVKYRLSADTKNRLDFCRHCDEIWLDGGEWQLLACRDFSQRLLDILSDEWQQDIHQTELRERQLRRLEAELGGADARQVDRFMQWIKQHPQRKTILGFINQQTE